MFTLKLALVALALRASADDLSKPAISPAFDDARQERDLLNDLPARSYTSDTWGAGWIPEACYNEAVANKLSPVDFEVRNIKYSDCDAPWAICRHKDASGSWDEVNSILSRVPVGMRQYLANLVVIPGPGLAYMRGPVLTFTFNFLTLGVLSHEFTHILDLYALQSVVQQAGYPTGTRYSFTNLWEGAYNADVAVSSPYARKNQIENFADEGRWAMTESTHAGKLASYNANWWHVANQIYSYKDRLDRVIFTSTGRCTAKVDTTRAVPMSGSAKLIRGTAPGSSLEGTRVPEIVLPEGAFSDIIICNSTSI